MTTLTTTIKHFSVIALFGALAFACADSVTDTTDPRGAKPEADPDVATIDGAKSDAVTEWFTTIKGALTLEDGIKDTIDWPDWFHGYTVEMTAGQTVQVRVQATEHGYVRMYGPSHRMEEGQPMFDKAVVKRKTDRDGDSYSDLFEYRADEDGTYMVVYGPQWAWTATYKFETVCTDGCEPDNTCEVDEQCTPEQYCKFNGVVCVTEPCDVSFSTCEDREKAGSPCIRDEACDAGLLCIEGACTVNPESCTEDADCGEAGFCACMDWNCDNTQCKPYSPEGGHCGGFAPPQHISHCSPDFKCIGPNFIADMPGSCGTSATVEELLANPEDYQNRFVGLEAWIQTSVAMCTQMACSPENMCCNSCGAGQFLYDTEQGDFPAPDAGIELQRDGKTYTCGGDNCNYMENCSVQDGSYWIGGFFRKGEHFGWYLEVTREYGSPIILPTE